MKRFLAVAVMLPVLFALSTAALALEVPEAMITTGISERTPIDAVDTYPASVGKLFCFTRVTGALGEATVTHVWYRNGEEVARIELPVRSGDWRTRSSKTIPPEGGTWKVEVLDAEGNILKSLTFTLS